MKKKQQIAALVLQLQSEMVSKYGKGIFSEACNDKLSVHTGYVLATEPKK